MELFEEIETLIDHHLIHRLLYQRSILDRFHSAWSSEQQTEEFSRETQRDLYNRRVKYTATPFKHASESLLREFSRPRLAESSREMAALEETLTGLDAVSRDIQKWTNFTGSFDRFEGTEWTGDLSHCLHAWKEYRRTDGGHHREPLLSKIESVQNALDECSRHSSIRDATANERYNLSTAIDDVCQQYQTLKYETQYKSQADLAEGRFRALANPLYQN